ncbi:MAG: XrtA/PEP-CTERM system histidine kinase PrsK [Pseudomonadota bacterium]
MAELVSESGYWLAATMFAGLAVVLLFNFRGGTISWAALLLAAATSVFAVSHALAHRLVPLSPTALEYFEIARIAAWFVLLTAILRLSQRPTSVNGLIVSGHLFWIALLGLQFFPTETLWLAAQSRGLIDVVVLHLIAALLTILLIEQVYRNSREKRRNGIRFLCIGLGVPAAYELCLAAHAVLFGAPSEVLAVPRGIVIAMAAPLIAVGLQRSAPLGVGIFVSRQIVFYSATLMATGAYLLAMAIVGFWLQSLNLAWGALLQGVFFVGAIGVLIWILFSESLRASFRVWLHKNFFENKYDYREEWLRLTQTLASAGDDLPLGERSVKGLAQVVNAHSGALWTIDAEGQAFVREYALNSVPSADELAFDHPLIEFLDERRWVLDFRDALRQPDRYESIAHTLADMPFSRTALLIPLQYENRLLGLIELEQHNDSQPLNFEDHDLLKTAGQQIASYLAQRNTARLLAESRQFEAFNKFTAFVMHDLNNLIAQQRLIVQNAKRFRSKPEFVDDAFKTIENSVQRMEGLLTQLRERSATSANQMFDVAEVVENAIARNSERTPAPTLLTREAQLWVQADPDRLEAVVGHMLRNAQDATPSEGSVEVRIEQDDIGNSVHVEIADTGVGMTAEFIRDQLFSPFVSTKGSQGMGIGVYQTREYLRMIGGDLYVESSPGQGTTMRLAIPRATARP